MRPLLAKNSALLQDTACVPAAPFALTAVEGF